MNKFLLGIRDKNYSLNINNLFKNYIKIRRGQKKWKNKKFCI